MHLEGLSNPEEKLEKRLHRLSFQQTRKLSVGSVTQLSCWEIHQVKICSSNTLLL